MGLRPTKPRNPSDRLQSRKSAVSHSRTRASSLTERHDEQNSPTETDARCSGFCNPPGLAFADDCRLRPAYQIPGWRPRVSPAPCRRPRRRIRCLQAAHYVPTRGRDTSTRPELETRVRTQLQAAKRSANHATWRTLTKAEP